MIFIFVIYFLFNTYFNMTCEKLKGNSVIILFYQIKIIYTTINVGSKTVGLCKKPDNLS